METNDLFNVLNRDYDLGTGIWPFMNNKFEIYLDEEGKYKTVFKDRASELTVVESKELSQTNYFLSEYNEYDISKKLFESIKEIKYNLRIGYYKSLYAGHVSEGDFRENASSGGFGTWIFTELLRLGYIDSVIHVKKSNKNGILFEYSISHSKSEILDGAKTKYYPVELSQVLDIVSTVPGKYAVIGVPSFIMELRLLCEQNSLISERIKFFIGLVCGHQKSTKFTDLLVWQSGIDPNNLISIDYRKKNPKNMSNSYSIEVVGTIDGKVKNVNKEVKELYGSDWGKGLFKVRGSDFIDDVMNETADLTLGDAWLPQYVRDSKGNNILIVRNQIIQDIIDKAIIENRIKLDSIDEQTIINSQLSHFRHTQDELKYRLYKKNKLKEWVPKTRSAVDKNIPFFRKKIQDIREELCLKAPQYFDEAINLNDFEFFKSRLNHLDNKYKLYYKLMNIQNKLKN